MHILSYVYDRRAVGFEACAFEMQTDIFWSLSQPLCGVASTSAVGEGLSARRGHGVCCLQWMSN
jgi:hypothetical protein